MMSTRIHKFDYIPIPIPENSMCIGKKIIRFYHNNKWYVTEVDPIYVNADSIHDSILNETIDNGGQITIEEKVETWDDIPDVNPIDLAKAQSITDSIELQLPPVPKPQTTNQPSWD